MKVLFAFLALSLMMSSSFANVSFICEIGQEDCMESKVSIVSKAIDQKTADNNCKYIASIHKKKLCSIYQKDLSERGLLCKLSRYNRKCTYGTYDILTESGQRTDAKAYCAEVAYQLESFFCELH